MTLLTPMRLSVLVCLCGFMAARAQNPQPADPPLGQQKPSNVIEGIEFSGISRVSPDTLRAAILTKVGDVYDQDSLRRDFTTLWNTNRFTDIQLKKRGDRGGVILRFVVIERAL